MRYDLLVKNGTIIDGTGAERYAADVGVLNGRIEAIGNLGSASDEIVDARGLVVSPGFIDGHTHLDAQVFWEPLGSSSCYQGVTTAVHGNCGFTLAPLRADLTDTLLEHFEAAEALPLEALRSGLDIRWESFADYFDVLDDIPKGINYAGYVGHSALRIEAMGERAFSADARGDDIEQMADGVRQAMRAGAIGFSTSRVSHQRLRDGRLISSGHAPWHEVCQLVKAMGDTGVFELAREKIDPDDLDAYDFPDRLCALAVETGRPTMLGVFHAVDEPGAASLYMSMIDAAARQGGNMVAQVHTGTMYNYFSFLARVPFAHEPTWASLQGLTAMECRRKLMDPEFRQRLTGALDAQGAHAQDEYANTELVTDFNGANETLAALARERRCHPAEVVIDEALKHNLETMFRQPFANVDDDQTLSLLKHPHAVPTFSDAGAHVSEVADSCIPSVLLGKWVRDQQQFSLEQAVHLITGKMAGVWGFADRGVLQPGKTADITVFDPDNIRPTMPEVRHDFPNGMARIAQGCDGIAATIVNGTTLLRDGEHSGAFPGRLLKGAAAQ